MFNLFFQAEIKFGSEGEEAVDSLADQIPSLSSRREGHNPRDSIPLCDRKHSPATTLSTTQTSPKNNTLVAVPLYDNNSHAPTTTKTKEANSAGETNTAAPEDASEAKPVTLSVTAIGNKRTNQVEFLRRLISWDYQVVEWRA